jgi:hypothetical protein
MSANVPQQGNESRASILPSVAPSGIGFLGSSYSPADALQTPAQIGVRVGNSMSDVVNAVKGVAFYTDMIGFGQSSSALTSGMPLAPLGVNYFLKTGQTCSNGADMYTYFEGIPRGDVLGTRVQGAMKEMGLPQLRGLAPGMMEDAKSALNPAPMLRALFGSGYPQCRLEKRQVGDLYGKIRDPATGEPWIDDPDSARPGSDGLLYQEKWVQDRDSAGNPISLSREQWAKAPKTHNPDGTSKLKKEGFVGTMTHPATLGAVAVLGLIAYGVLTVRRR